MRPHPPAIVLGLDSTINLSIIRELGQKDVPVIGVGTAATSMAAASRHCSQAIIRPAGPIMSWMPDIVRRTGAMALFAVSETDLLQLASGPKYIGKCQVLTPRLEQLQRALSKSDTLSEARKLGFDVPQTWQPRAGEDFAARIAEQTFPAIAKWDNPNDILPLLEEAGLKWEKAEFVSNAGQLDRLLDRFQTIGRWPLIQSYCDGVGLGQMLYMRRDRATLRFQHVRLHEWPPEGGVSTLCYNEPLHQHQAQMKLSERLLQELEWEGPAMVEYRYDAARKRYWLMEVNGRYWGSLPLTRHCDTLFAWEAYRRSVLGQVVDAPVGRQDIIQARYMIPETKRLMRLLIRRSRVNERVAEYSRLQELRSYLADFVRPNMRYYVFDKDDTGPSYQDIRNMVGKIFKGGGHDPR